MIALTGHVEPRDVEAGRDAGFTDYVAKFEREALLASLQQCLSEPVAAATKRTPSPAPGRCNRDFAVDRPDRRIKSHDNRRAGTPRRRRRR